MSSENLLIQFTSIQFNFIYITPNCSKWTYNIQQWDDSLNTEHTQMNVQHRLPRKVAGGDETHSAQPQDLSKKTFICNQFWTIACFFSISFHTFLFYHVFTIYFFFTMFSQCISFFFHFWFSAGDVRVAQIVTRKLESLLQQRLSHLLWWLSL